MGFLKGYKLKLNVNTSVKPVVQPVRRNPFDVREKVEKKLDELLACGIIEEVPEGTNQSGLSTCCYNHT